MERRAFRIAQFSLADHDDARDVVQEAMMKLAQRYLTRPASEWPALFHRILHNRITDFQRRNSIRRRWISFLGNDDKNENAIDNFPDISREPQRQVLNSDFLLALSRSLQDLPARQREVVALRLLEGHDVATSAKFMGCSEGSVKTHLSRALASLKGMLEGYSNGSA